MEIAHEIRRRGGLAPTHQLLAAGIPARWLTAATRSGAIIRVRQGWYAVPEVPEDRLAAWRVGGLLTCHRGARAHGLWALDEAVPHVLVRPSDARLRHPDDRRRRRRPEDHAIVHWRDALAPSPRFLASPLDCLIDLLGCDRPELVLAAADSAVRAGLVSPRRWRRALERMPARYRHLARVDRRSESIAESVTRYGLLELGLRPRLQVSLLPGIRVDLLVGRRLVVEVDGRQFHEGASSFQRDRERDAALRRAGYRVLRFSYAQVIYGWPTVRATILAALADGDQR